MSEELDKLKQVYNERKSLKIDYSFVLPQNYYFVSSREKIFISSLLKYFGTDYSDLKVLDLGFGSGNDILNLIKAGFKVENISGVEVIEERFQYVKSIIPNADLKLNNGFNIPFEDNKFDLVIQSTVFSSILNPESRNKLANEIIRVLKPKGKVFFYDIRFNNPWNKNVIKMDKDEINRIFPNGVKNFNYVTLNPIVVRKIASKSIILCELLEKIPLFCSHYYTVIEK